MSNFLNTVLVIALAGIISGCSSTQYVLRPTPTDGQTVLHRAGKTYLSSTKQNTSVLISVHPEVATDDKPQSIMMTIRNTGTQSISVAIENVSLKNDAVEIPLWSKTEIVAASRSRESWQSFAMALAGGLQASGAAVQNSTFTATSNTQYRSNYGAPMGSSSTTTTGTIYNPAAAQARADDISRRTGQDIAALQSTEEQHRRTMDDLYLDRETIFPGRSITVMVTPKLADRGLIGNWVLVLRAGQEEHSIRLTRSLSPR